MSFKTFHDVFDRIIAKAAYRSFLDPGPLIQTGRHLVLALHKETGAPTFEAIVHPDWCGELVDGMRLHFDGVEVVVRFDAECEPGKVLALEVGRLRQVER